MLRPYVSADFNTLWALDQVCFSPEIAYTKYELEQFLDYPGAFIIVAEENGVIHGFILTHAHKKIGHIITIDVRDSHRRTGLGSLLLKASEERLRELGKQGIVLEVAVDNLSALTFYKRHGFSVVKTIPRYYSNGLDALEMTKPLTPA
ncbi:MAG TPA: N-acetyltransferase [Terriglobales bacterium]|nr:N-acetyltransferase [Terriglobales bacterium]